MTNKIHDLRLPAEWEDYKAVLLSWPHADTDWAYMLNDVQKTVCEISKAVVASGLKVIIVAPGTDEPRGRLKELGDNVLYYDVATNDTWTRDYGVVTCKHPDGKSVLCDFKFNGWGLKFASCYDNLVTRKMFESQLLEGEYVNHLGFVLEGGSIESDGEGTILTTSLCLESLNRNGNLDRNGIEKYLSSALGANRFLWLDYGYLAGDDTDSHIDTLARLVARDTIVYVKCDDPEDEHFNQLESMENQLKSFVTPDGQPYHLVALPLPDPILDEDGNRLPATYANFLITPNAILLPVYGQEKKDFLATQMMRIVFPDREIVPIDCNSLIRQHGSLHCMTMQLYDIPL